MNCREFVDFLMAYLDRELSDGERSTFEEHISDCPPCGDYLETYREAVRLGKRACRDDEGPVPEEVPEALVEAILAARNAS